MQDFNLEANRMEITFECQMQAHFKLSVQNKNMSRIFTLFLHKFCFDKMRFERTKLSF